MDELKIKLSTKLMRSAAATLASMYLKKKFGCKAKIQINDLDIEIVDGEAKIALNAEAKLNSWEFIKLVKKISQDEE